MAVRRRSRRCLTTVRTWSRCAELQMRQAHPQKDGGPMTSSMPLGNRTRIDIRAIERELSTLWKHIAETYRNGDQPAVTRVCVLNLLVCVSNSALADRMTDVIAQLTTRHP